MEAYKEGVVFGNSLGDTAQDIAMLGLNVETEGDVKKLQVSARGKYLAILFLISLDRRQCRELILLLKN